SSREKFSASDSRQITSIFSPSRSTRGAARDRHETRGGMRWTRGVVARFLRVDERRRSAFAEASADSSRARRSLLAKTGGRGRQSRVVLTPRRWRQVLEKLTLLGSD